MIATLLIAAAYALPALLSRKRKRARISRSRFSNFHLTHEIRDSVLSLGFFNEKSLLISQEAKHKRRKTISSEYIS